jgi:hypothetical protein
MGSPERQRVAVDFDDTMCPTYDHMKVKHHFGPLPDFYDLGIDIASDSDGRMNLIEFIDEELPNMAPIEGSVDALQELAERKDILVVTGKPRETERATSQWIHHYFGDIFRHVLYSDRFNPEGCPAKRDICQRLGITALIDDFPDQNLASGTVHLLFGFDKKGGPQVPKQGEIWVPDWPAVLQYFNEQNGLNGAGFSQPGI